MSKEYTNIPVNVKSAGEDTLWTVMSTNDIDRHGEAVVQSWNIDNFMNNPVVLNSHQYNDTTEAIGRVEALVQKENSLEGKIKFAINENPKAKVIFDLYKGGFLNAFSVGFIPGEETNELLELSAVTIPANALALAKAKGLDVDAIDEEDMEVSTESIEIDKPEEGTGEPKEEASGDTEPDEAPEELKETEEEIKDLYQKAGRVLSASSKKKIQSAIEALQDLLEADNKSYEEEEDKEEDEEVAEVKVDANIKSVLKALRKEISETHKENLPIKKKKIYKALRSVDKSK